jgi:hypothetical protein
MVALFRSGTIWTQNQESPGVAAGAFLLTRGVGLGEVPWNRRGDRCRAAVKGLERQCLVKLLLDLLEA